jgi:putative flippase GtrA
MAADSPRRRIDATLFRQFVKYGIVGVGNTALTFVIYTVGVEIGVLYLLALVVGYVAGGFNSYMFNRHWTFRARHLSHASSGGRFALVQGCAIAANLVLLYVLVHHLHVDKIVSQALLSVPVVAITFFINRKWTFGRRPGEPLTSQPVVR